MELDEIKSAWTAMDERLKKNEGLHERLIKEMLMQKSSKSLRKLSNYEMFGIICGFLLFPLLLYLLPSFKQTLIHQIEIHSALGFVFLCVISQLYKLILILKIDLQKKIKENIAITQRYNIYIKRETIVGTVVVSIFLFVCVFGLLLQQNVESWRWTFVLVAVFGVWPLGVYWQYKKIYKANIQSILDSLDELKDLEE